MSVPESELYDMYKVSILVPIYKVEQYIERCARSLFEQSYPNLEYVFVDDCSPDRSVEILERVMMDYPERAGSVRIVRHLTNKGLAGARNTALDHAMGEFVCVVDSDDWLELDGISLLVSGQIETNADIVSGNANLHYEDRVEELKTEKYPSKDVMLTQLLKDTWTMNSFIWGRLYRRSLYEDYHIRCKEGCDYAEDRYQVVRLAYYSNSFSVVDAAVYNYNKVNESSFTKLQDINIGAFLKNQYQHLQNWIGIRDFFVDKESAYYQLAVANTSRLLRLNLDWALKYKTEHDFRKIVGQIEENDDCMRLLGWQRTGVKGILLHNYRLMKLKQLSQRSLRFIKRKLHLAE